MGNDITAGHVWADTPTGKRVDVENLNRAFSDATLKETAISARTAKSPIVLSDQFLLTDGALKKATMQAIVDLVSGNLGAGSVNAAALDVTAITGQTAKTALVDADTFLVWDSEASELKKVTRSNLLGATLITGQTEKTSLVDADTFLIWDSAASVLKKVTRETLAASVQRAGSVLQTVYSEDATKAIVSGTFPIDGTAITWSNGTEYAALEAKITPSSASNKILIQAGTFLTSETGLDSRMMAVFAGKSGTALASASTGFAYYDATYGPAALHLKRIVVPGVTTELTYSVRVGSSGGNTTINGRSSVAVGGGTLHSYLMVQEIKG